MRLLLLNVFDLKIKVFLYFAHFTVFHNFCFSLRTYRSSCSQTSAFEVGHFSDPGLSLGSLLHRPPSSKALAQSPPHFQRRIRLELQLSNQQFQPTFLRNTYLPEEVFSSLAFFRIPDSSLRPVIFYCS